MISKAILILVSLSFSLSSLAISKFTPTNVSQETEERILTIVEHELNTKSFYRAEDMLRLFDVSLAFNRKYQSGMAQNPNSHSSTTIVSLPALKLITIRHFEKVIHLSERREYNDPLLQRSYLEALYELGILYLRETHREPEEFEKALDLLKKSANKGHVISALRLKKMYEQGIDVEKDPELAEEWLNKSKNKNPVFNVMRNPPEEIEIEKILQNLIIKHNFQQTSSENENKTEIEKNENGCEGAFATAK